MFNATFDDSVSDKQRMPPPAMKMPQQRQPQVQPEMRFAAKKTILKSASGDMSKPPSFHSNPSPPTNSIGRPPSSVTDQELWDLYGIPPPSAPQLSNANQGRASSGQNSSHSSINDVLDTSGTSGPHHVYNVSSAQVQKKQQRQQTVAQVPQKVQQVNKPLMSIVPDSHDPNSPLHYQSSSYRRFDFDSSCQAVLFGQVGGQHSGTQSVSSETADSPEKCRRGSSSGLSSIAGSVIFRGSHLGLQDSCNSKENFDKSSSKMSSQLEDISFNTTDTSCITSPIVNEFDSSMESETPVRDRRQTSVSNLPPVTNGHQMRRISTDSIKIPISLNGANTTNTSILSTDSMAPGNGALNSTHHSGTGSVTNGTPIRQVVKGRFFGGKSSNNSNNSPQTSSPIGDVKETPRFERRVSISDCNINDLVDAESTIKPEEPIDGDNACLRRSRSEASLPQPVNIPAANSPNASVQSLEWFAEIQTPSKNQSQQTENINSQPPCDASCQTVKATSVQAVSIPSNECYMYSHEEFYASKKTSSL